MMTIQTKNDSFNWKWLSEILDPKGKICSRLGISLDWKTSKSPFIQVSDKIGLIQFKNPDTKEKLNIMIHPKVPGSVTGMLSVVLDLRPKYGAVVDKSPAEIGFQPSTWLSSIYLKELNRFLIRLRQRGEETEEDLTGRAKGRFLVDSYIKRNYWTKRHIIPSRFIDWTDNNLPNRILNYALFLSRLALRDLKSNASLELGIARRCEAALTNVDLARIYEDDFAKVSPLIQGPFRHYKRIIQLAKWIISIFDPFALESKLAEDLPVLKIFDHFSSKESLVEWDLVNMPKLFEQYVRIITRGKKSQRSYPIQLSGDLPPHLAHLSDKTMKLDREPIVFNSQKGKLVIDAKYKPLDSSCDKTPRICLSNTIHLSEYQCLDLANKDEILPIDIANRQISNLDIYQAISYATHKFIRASAAALVYPSSRSQSPKQISSYEGLGFRYNDEFGMPVYILTIRIDQRGIQEEEAGKGIRSNIKHIVSKNLVELSNHQKTILTQE
jgi:5-methylcytosine-specific restriction endonuclease McrBC regulatory subunit McrC